MYGSIYGNVNVNALIPCVFFLFFWGTAIMIQLEKSAYFLSFFKLLLKPHDK